MQDSPRIDAAQWWEQRRLRYNLALVAAIVLGYFAFVAVVTHYGNVIRDAEVGGIAVIFHCCGAGLELLLANVCYLLGAAVERYVPAARVRAYRTWAWRAGLAVSCFLPFSIALLHLVLVMFFPGWYAHPEPATPLEPYICRPHQRGGMILQIGGQDSVE